MCSYMYIYQSGPQFVQLTWTPAKFKVNLTLLMHIVKSLLNTLARAVEQLARCLTKQAKVKSQGQSTTIMHPAQKVKMCYKH